MEKLLVAVKMAIMVWTLMYIMTLDGFNDELTQILVHIKLEN
jgi:hypothetical protein